MDESLIHKLQKLDARHRAEFEAALRRKAARPAWRFADQSGSAGGFAPMASQHKIWLANARAARMSGHALARGVWQHIQGRLGALRASGVRHAGSVPFRKIATACAAAAGLSVAVAATLVVKGYAQDPAPLLERIQDRQGSAIFSQDRQLLGAVFPQATKSADLNYADFGYIPLDGRPPETWIRYVTTLEQKTLFDPYRNVCGIDLLGMVKRIVTGTGGGSGLAQQLVKGLHEPEQVRSPHFLVAAVQKFVELGESCRLHQTLGGAEGVLKLYAAYAPVAQINGVTRGVEAGAWTLLGKSPVDLSDVDSALLAAAVQRPYAAVPAATFANGCDVLLALKSPEATQTQQQAAAQCRTLRRARHAIKEVLDGPQLVAALDELDGLERTGVQPVNPFKPISTKRVVNLSSRTAAALAPGMVARIAEEAEALDTKPGEPITLTIGQHSQSSFVADVNKALAGIDASANGREQFCVALAPGGRHRHCAGAPEERARADIILARVDIATGGLTRLYESNRLAFSARNSIGSVAKAVVAMAAVKHGLKAETLVCPRRARDGARWLRRETRPEHGYADCGPEQLITFAEVMARSDSLGAYEIARHTLGDERLHEALSVLGLTPAADTKNLAYDLSFGTQAATPGELLEMGQALFGVVYDVPVRSAAPRLLAMTTTEPSVYAAVRDYLPDAAQRRELRSLLEAPVTHPRGTLRAQAGVLGAGKTGTVSAALRPNANSRPYIGGKYVLAYLPADRSVALVSVTAPAPYPLGVNWLQGAVLTPAMAPLFR